MFKYIDISIKELQEDCCSEVHAYSAIIQLSVIELEIVICCRWIMQKKKKTKEIHCF